MIKAQRSLLFFSVSAVLIAVTTYIAYRLQASTLEGASTYSFMDFLNDGKTTPSMQDLIIGLTFGTMFGAMDAIGTWVGMAETTYALPGFSPEMQASLAGLYSNVMSISVSTVVTLIVRMHLGSTNEQRPIWINVLGIFIGSTLGIIIGAVFLA
tara:strand:+ start:156 stop:617 length:462 start_codon:yes stop_codon:yes gene_type:complete